MADDHNTEGISFEGLSDLGVPANVSNDSLNELLAVEAAALDALVMHGSPTPDLYREIAHRGHNVSVWATEIDQRLDADQGQVSELKDKGPLIEWLVGHLRDRVTAVDDALWELELGSPDVEGAVDALTQLVSAAEYFCSYRLALQGESTEDGDDS